MPKRQEASNMDDPDEMAAWCFSAGIPDPRGVQYGYQPLIPAPCFPAVSRMLWEFGFRHHADLQTRWVSDYSGPDRNFVALGVTDVNPENVMRSATEMLVDQFPEVAERLAAITDESRDVVVAEQAERLRESLERLNAARKRLDEGR